MNKVRGNSGSFQTKKRKMFNHRPVSPLRPAPGRSGFAVTDIGVRHDRGLCPTCQRLVSEASNTSLQHDKHPCPALPPDTASPSPSDKGMPEESSLRRHPKEHPAEQHRERNGRYRRKLYSPLPANSMRYALMKPFIFPSITTFTSLVWKLVRWSFTRRSSNT